jgi:predicted transcriptional regulator
MTQIAISDEVASTLSSAATARGCTQGDLASVLIANGLRHEEEFAITPDQQARILHSFAQAERGELIDGEIVMERFAKALQESASR